MNTHPHEAVLADFADRLAASLPGSIDASRLDANGVHGGGPTTEWARSGAMWLTGRPEGPPLAPAAPVASIMRIISMFLDVVAPRPLHLDGPRLLGERAAIFGHRRGGTISCGGSARMIEAADGWLCANLPREDDLALVPAWLSDDNAGDDVWRALSSRARDRPVVELVERGQLLGLPVSPVETSDAPFSTGPVTAAPLRRPMPFTIGALAPRSTPSSQPLVVDLSSLWAGPLCTSILAMTGARVIKVEAPRRPDGTRFGPRPFFDLLNAGKESVDDLALIPALVAAADVVVTSSRVGSLAALGVSPDERTIWCRVRAYPDPTWVGLGDDATAASGLSTQLRRTSSDPPLFCGDALADPIAGLTAAVAVLACLGAQRGAQIDVVLRDAAASTLLLHGPPTAGDERTVERPVARAVTGAGPGLGAHTATVAAFVG